MWPFSSGKTKTSIDDVKSRIKQETQPLNEAPKQRFITIFNQISAKKYNSESLLQLAETVSQLNSVINYICSKAQDINIKHVRYLGNGKTKDLGDTELLKEIYKLNRSDVIQQLIIHGNGYILKQKTPGFIYPTDFEVMHSPSMYNIPQYALDQYGNPVLNIPQNENPLICYRQELETGQLKRLELDEIIHIKDSNPRKKGANYYYGASRLYAATQSLNVMKNMYETINTILSAKGALGFLSRTSKTGELDPMMWKDIIAELEDKINYGYGTTEGRKAIMATFADAKWNRMDSPIQDFLPIELTSQEFSQLCNQLGGIPDIIFNSKGNTTYNNYDTAIKVFYINCFQPLMSNILNTISQDLGITKVNEWLEADYSEIECLNETSLDKIIYLFDNNMLTKNQVLELVGMPESSDASFNEISKEENGNQDKSDLPANN